MAKSDEAWMQHALSLAHKAYELGEVPVGAVLVHEGECIGEGWNQAISTYDPSAHAEIIALRDGAQSLENYRLVNTTLYVTLEPCAMCTGAMVHARIERLVYASPEPKAGCVHSQLNLLDAPYLNHKVQVDSGLCNAEASSLMTGFFAQRRAQRRAERNAERSAERSAKKSTAEKEGD